MKNLFVVWLATICLFVQPAAVLANGTNPVCILMKFTDDTRFDKIDSAGTLADMVMEKLLNSGKFNFKETKVIDKNLEKLLYDERAEEFINARNAISHGDYNTLFEGPGFNENRAQSIASALQGQIVSPAIVSEIGNEHNAEYLIQGTIVNIGTGAWVDDQLRTTAQYANQVMSMGGMGGMGGMQNIYGILSSIGIKKIEFGVQADLRLIKASTGEVVWSKRTLGKDSKQQVSVSFIKIGSDKLDNEMYYKAMNSAAQVIADTLIADHDAGKFFLK